jgi:glutamate dehydrogenase/leucine dehydrogenase/CBS domain-containing protein
MIPESMLEFLSNRLPPDALRDRLISDGSRRYLEFNPLDVDRLARLDITVDALGPRLVVGMWDEESPLEIGGYLVVDNLAMGRPSMGGIRMLPDVTPAAIFNLARGMTLKNAAANLPYGGGKSGIVSKTGLSSAQHNEVVRGFAHLIKRYRDIYLPGPDVGTNDADMKTVAIENGLDSALSKPVDMGGNRIDELGAAAGGAIIALQALLEEMPRLRVLPQFAGLHVPVQEKLTVLIQGFGAVGAHAARFLQRRLPGVRVTGVSDIAGYLYNETGLPVDELFNLWKSHGQVTRQYAAQKLLATAPPTSGLKFSTAADDLLRESGFCLIPAAPIANYLDTDISTHPSMTVDHMGIWAVIVEGANTYSPMPARKLARARMERAVYRERGVLIATDYLVNSGGVIFAAQEHLIKTPPHLRIPDQFLGDLQSVQRWLETHAEDLSRLAEERLAAAERYREDVIRGNMRELIDLLVGDADMLPCEAAERISVRRIAARESDRTAAELMEPMPTISISSTVQQAAARLIECGCAILAVLDETGALAGVVTEWDITRATALGSPDHQPLREIMTREVVTVSPDDPLLITIRKLEYHSISAMPVVDQGNVVGMISADMLARRSLMRLLQSQPAS